MQRADSFTGFGKRPDLTPSHQQVLPRGMTVKTCESRTNPVSGIVVCSIKLPFCYPVKFQAQPALMQIRPRLGPDGVFRFLNFWPVFLDHHFDGFDQRGFSVFGFRPSFGVKFLYVIRRA